MPRTSHASADFAPTLTYASLSCSIILLWSTSACGFSLPSAGPAAVESFRHRLVGHVDQLQQRRDHDRDPSTPVPPPHLFCLAAPGGDVCLIVDEKGAYHAVRDKFPPLGVPVSQTGVVDSQVDAIGDSLLGTRFHLKDGTVRGSWCPGGGTAGLVLLRLARHRRGHRLAGLLVAASGRQTQWAANRASPSLRIRGRRRGAGAGGGLGGGGWTAARRGRPSGLSEATATALEVLAVTEEPDGSLWVALPCAPSASASGAAGAEEEGGDSGIDERLSITSATAGVEGDAVATRRPESSPCDTPSWVEECGLAGYDY
ncbi:unnamed protein product [Scytosiphon promiscuus]